MCVFGVFFWGKFWILGDEFPRKIAGIDIGCCGLSPSFHFLASLFLSLVSGCSLQVGLHFKLVFTSSWSSLQVGLHFKLVFTSSWSSSQVGLQVKLVFKLSWSSSQVGLQVKLVFKSSLVFHFSSWVRRLCMRTTRFKS